MGKNKKKKPVADKTRSKRKEQEQKINPFELKINRQKHEILGRKLTKYDKGNPGVSRLKASKKRMHTLLREHEQQHKSNRFVDRRFGERDKSLSAEEKMMKRYAIERSKNTSANKFNLNEDEDLTHFGQSLAEIEQFDEPVISDEEEDDDDKRAAAKLVAEEHFGGFLTKKVDSGEKKTWKERMEELIAQSKQQKHEKQVEKEKNEQLTEEVDEQWKQLQGIVNLFRGKGSQKDVEVKPKQDDYDIAVRELLFEIKGKATDRLKTEEEIAKEEKERLDKLEADRIRRMKGLPEKEEKKAKHVSADDLDDGFDFSMPDFDYVSYKDGKLLTEDKSSSKSKNSSDDESDEEDDDDDAEEDDDEEVDEEGVDKEQVNENEEDDVENEKEEEEDDDDDDDDDDDNDDEDDNFSDLDSDSEDDGSEDQDIVSKSKKVGKEKKEKNTDAEDETVKMTDEEKQQMIETAKKELPYTFEAPKMYDNLLDMLEGHDLENQLTIIDRIRKCHHPSLAEGNKDKLEILFSHLVQFYGDLCIQDPPQLDFADRIVKHLYELTQLSPLPSAKTVLASLIERQGEFREICERKKGRGLYPALDTLLLFKLVSFLFPTSDFYHYITTPALIFMCQVLAQSPVTHGRDVVAGIFICNICLEYVHMSKRYLPEVINFLNGLLFMAADKNPEKLEAVIPPFKPVGKHINLLNISSKIKRYEPVKWSLTTMLAPVIEEEMYDSDDFRVTAVQHCVCLLDQYSQIYSSYPSYKEIFMPILNMCDKLPVNKYPKYLQNHIEKFKNECRTVCEKPKPTLAMEIKKPKPLKMFEPAFEEEFTGRKRGKQGQREYNDKQKLQYKHRQAMKGAKRELRKDTRFLARHRLQDQLDKDSERKRKVKQIYGALATQEGDYKKMKRGKVPD